jgi:hypothetical protein
MSPASGKHVRTLLPTKRHSSFTSTSTFEYSTLGYRACYSFLHDVSLTATSIHRRRAHLVLLDIVVPTLLVLRCRSRLTRLVHHLPMSQDMHNASRGSSPPRRGNLRTDIASEAYGGGWSAGPDRRIRDGGGSGHPQRASPDHGDHLLRSSSPSRTTSRPHSPPREQHARTPPRHRTPTPIPDTEPSEAYLAAAITPSTPLSSPSDLRKLLILDLNGSLLIRAGHRAASNRAGEPRLRPVHPRPYMSSFRNYLFHEGTRNWLDVMVWSSAQPHSVDSMVDECFGGTKNALVAVWARDTLGLSAAQYSTSPLTYFDRPRAHLCR